LTTVATTPLATTLMDLSFVLVTLDTLEMEFFAKVTYIVCSRRFNENICKIKIMDLKEKTFGNVFLIDIDECLTKTNNCDENAICTNTNGSFICDCKNGYSGDGQLCEGVPQMF
jgi:hypothetical protein